MPNRLADATSPYLLQHADNPVDWWEWSEGAFAEARERDVPILLSVGYAACHWCHVMAHESFEDPTTASLMNQRFVNVKVDREERPDVDSIYMEAVQAMTGQGGWPMTVWMDHEGRPFYAGTYFPRSPHHGMPSFTQVIEAVSAAWTDRRDDVSEQAGRLVEAISREIPPSASPDVATLAEAYEQIESSFDSTNGGFGGAPKFPQQPVLEFLLRIHREPWASDAGAMLAKTLSTMAAGGIRDHIGGGFARYSVDSRWLVPHFEKMLYDNAQLARLYLWAGVELERPDFVEVARDTLDYMIRDLRHPDGGFFSSEDADSEGVEGKFYVWTPDQIHAVLGDSAQTAIDYFGVSKAGNFEGASILSIVGDEPPPGLAEIRERMFEARSARIRPGLDDKVIASWNGLAIRALAEAAAVLGNESYLKHAEDAATFIIDRLADNDGLMRSWRDCRTSVSGFVDDHASMAVALFTLYAATADVSWYERAVVLTHQLARFERPTGGFFTTAADSETLVKRPADFTDNPLPSGNALAAEALAVAHGYTGNPEWAAKAESAISAIGALIVRYPSMVGHHLAVAYSGLDRKQLAIVGPSWRDLAAVHWSAFRPGVVLAPSPSGSAAVPLLDGRMAGDPAVAFVCRDFVCDLPTSDPDELRQQLS